VLEVRQKSGELQKQYSQDLDKSFMNECIHFRAYLKDLPESIFTKTVLNLCKIMKDDNIYYTFTLILHYECFCVSKA